MKVSEPKLHKFQRTLVTRRVTATMPSEPHPLTVNPPRMWIPATQQVRKGKVYNRKGHWRYFKRVELRPQRELF